LDLGGMELREKITQQRASYILPFTLYRHDDEIKTAGACKTQGRNEKS